MTLDEAIKHAEEIAESRCDECGQEHKQLAEWLKELKAYREQEPCDDVVSRQAVLDTISELNVISFYEAQEDSKECYYEIKQAIKAMPSVGLQEPKWISASKRLPEDKDWYLGIFRESDTGWINPLPFICVYVGYKTKATTKEHWILRGFTDRDEHIDYYFNLECVAWMPLPKPYEPQESEDKE